MTTGGALANAQEPAAHVDAGQFAIARWKANEDGQRVMYFAAGFNQVNQTAAWPSVGYAGRAECREVDRGHHSFVICSGRARPVELAPGDFVVDPALQTATLKVTSEGMTHEVSWSATGDAPEPYFHQHAGTDVGAQVMTSTGRRATASGTLYGQTLEPAKGAFISQGTMVDVYLNGRGGHTVFDLRDGVLFFKQIFRA
jgi:hypothetical protein